MSNHREDGGLWILGGVLIGGALVCLGGLLVYWVTRRQTAVAGAAPLGNAAYHLRELQGNFAAARGAKSPAMGLAHASYAVAHLDSLERLGTRVRGGRATVLRLQDQYADALTAADPELSEAIDES